MIENFEFQALNKPYDSIDQDYAAVSILVHKNKEILFIKRNGIWDLPKGKLENNESLFKCAEREVEEECGVNQLTIKEKRCDFYTFYFKE